MALGLAARALIAATAFGLLCALGAGGAGAGGSPDAASSASRSSCPSTRRCKPPRVYNFRIGGTTEYRLGSGTETWSMRGKLRLVRRRSNRIRAEYWQASGRVTLAFKDIRYDAFDRCVNGGPAVGNAPAQTLPLRRNDVDVGFTFFPTRRRYELSTRANRDYDGVRGTVTCEDGSTVPHVFFHKFTHIEERRGLPRRVVRGSANFVDDDLERFRYSWRLTAARR
jgi:hypothetical protein